MSITGEGDGDAVTSRVFSSSASAHPEIANRSKKTHRSIEVILCMVICTKIPFKVKM